MAAQPREIRRYIMTNGRVPFAEWFDSLRDVKTQTIINKRLDRVRLGNLGDYRSVGQQFQIQILTSSQGRTENQETSQRES